MKIISLFCGVGGLDSGFLDPKFGHELVYANDYNEDAVATYRLNYPHLADRIICGDVGEVLATHRPPSWSCDILLGGFPCPAWSMAGKRKGFEDPRGQLFFRALEAVHLYQPRFFYFENVAGLSSHANGESLNHMVELLEDEGYSVLPCQYNAIDFGIPQRRKRIIIAGVSASMRAQFPNPNSFLPVCKSVDLSKSEVIEPLRLRSVLARVRAEFPNGAERVSSRNHNLHAPERKSHWIKILRQGENLKNLSKDEIRRREAEYGLPTDREIPTSFQDYRRLSEDEIAPTMMFGNTSLPIHPTEDRNISVREAATIQSFPMSFNFCGGISAQYKQVGNAVPPRLGYALAEALNNRKATPLPDIVHRKIGMDADLMVQFEAMLRKVS